MAEYLQRCNNEREITGTQSAPRSFTESYSQPNHFGQAGQTTRFALRPRCLQFSS